MGSEEFRVSMSGPSISSFFYEAANRPTDFEGLMFGDYQRSLHREISDQADAGDQNRPATVIHNVQIRRIVPTGARFSFYDRRFNPAMPDYVWNVVQEMNRPANANVGEGMPSRPVSTSLPKNPAASSTNQIGAGADGQEPLVRSGFLGWFRYQKVPPRFLQSELAICRLLSSVDALTGFPTLTAGGPGDISSYYPWPGNGCLYLFAYPLNKNNILEFDMRLMAFSPTANTCRNVRMTIQNLGDTTHADYWKIGDGGGTAAPGVDRLFPGIVSPSFSKHVMEETDRMAENAKQQLAATFDKAVTSSTRTYEQFLNSPKPLPMSFYYMKYGYSPQSSQEITHLVDHLESYVGRKASSDFRPEMEIDSPDLFNNSRASMDTAEKESGDIGKDWHVVDDAETAAASASIVEKTNKINISSNVVDQTPGHQNVTVRAKRPKNNTSSSSSGANSDEMPEPAQGSVDNGAAQKAKVQLTVKTVPAGSQGNTTPTSASASSKPNQSQQQRKKSKSSDSGSSEGQETAGQPSPSSVVMPPLTASATTRMVRPGLHTSNSPVSVGRGVPLPSKGRGNRLANSTNPPPGLSKP